MNRRRFYLCFLILCVAIGVFGSIWWFARPAAKLPEHFLASATPVSEDLVDDARCLACHSDIHKKFQHSGMCSSWNTWADAEPIEDRTEGPGPVRTIGDLHYQVIIENGRMFQREFRITDGKEVELNRREAHYALGSGTKGRSYLNSVNGYLTQLPLSWFSQAQRWDISPGYEHSNRRFDRPIPKECVDCHNAATVSRPGSINAFQEPLPTGLGCQRCHGPGREHVNYQLQGTGTDTMVRIKSLPVERQQDVCLQCHLISDYQAPPIAGAKHFKPGEKLSEVRTDFFRVSQSAAFLATGHGPRSMASKCYTESDGKMTCILCHDPHRPADADCRKYTNKRCNECHVNQLCKRPLAKDEKAQAGDCVECHMPSRQTSDVSHAVATEHWIHTPGKKDHLGAPFPLPKDPKQEIVGFGEGIDERSAAYAELKHYLRYNNKERLAEAVAKLNEKIGTVDNVDYHNELGRGLIVLGKHEDAAQRMSAALLLNPDDADARRRMAEAYSRLGKPKEAVEELYRLLRRTPWHAESDEHLFLLLEETNTPQRAEEFWKQTIQFHPPKPEVLLLYARLRSKAGAPTNEIRDILRSAGRADGASSVPFESLAMLDLQEKKIDEAQENIQKALDRQPSSVSARLLFAQILFAKNAKEKAAEVLEKVIQDEPDNKEARNFLQTVRGGTQ